MFRRVILVFGMFSFLVPALAQSQTSDSQPASTAAEAKAEDSSQPEPWCTPLDCSNAAAKAKAEDTLQHQREVDFWTKVLDICQKRAKFRLGEHAGCNCGDAARKACGSKTYSVVFGYGFPSSGDIVIDQYLLIAFLKKLLQPDNGTGMSGFKPLNFNPDSLKPDQMPTQTYSVERTIGADTIRINVNHSSYSTSHVVNRNLAQLQPALTTNTTNAIHNAITSADGVFYVGHILNEIAFGPAAISHDGIINSISDGKTMLEFFEKVKAAKTHPDMLGFFGCNSYKLKDNALEAGFKGTLITSTETMYFTSLMCGVYSTLDSLIMNRCDSALDKLVTSQFNITKQRDPGFCVDRPTATSDASSIPPTPATKN